MVVFLWHANNICSWHAQCCSTGTIHSILRMWCLSQVWRRWSGGGGRALQYFQEQFSAAIEVSPVSILAMAPKSKICKRPAGARM